MKTCHVCGECKDTDAFRRRSQNSDGRAGKCRECAKTYHRKHHYAASYGISVETRENMLCDQEHRCAICGIHEQDCNHIFRVDHNHATGKVRGLLCHNCNVGIGHLKDSVEVIRAAARYLMEND